MILDIEGLFERVVKTLALNGLTVCPLGKFIGKAHYSPDNTCMMLEIIEDIDKDFKTGVEFVEWVQSFPNQLPPEIVVLPFDTFEVLKKYEYEYTSLENGYLNKKHSRFISVAVLKMSTPGEVFDMIQETMKRKGLK